MLVDTPSSGPTQQRSLLESQRHASMHVVKTKSAIFNQFELKTGYNDNHLTQSRALILVIPKGGWLLSDANQLCNIRASASAAWQDHSQQDASIVFNG